VMTNDGHTCTPRSTAARPAPAVSPWWMRERAES
jgi:hypothetical protein